MSVPTPYLCIDINRVLNNCRRMRGLASGRGVDLRPHVKTHRTLDVAVCQCFAGTAGEQKELARTCFSKASPAMIPTPPPAPALAKIVVSTLAEAEFYCSKDERFRDILLGRVLQPLELERVNRLRRVNPAMSVMIDSEASLEAILALARKAAAANEEAEEPALKRARTSGSPVVDRWRVWLAVDCGYGREGCGSKSDEAIRMAILLARTHCRFVEFMGLYSHSGDSYNVLTAAGAGAVAVREVELISDLVDRLETTSGVRCPNVGVGATPSCTQLPKDIGRVTEIHPGNYCVFDKFQASIGVCDLMQDVGARVRTSVIGRYPDRHLILVDAGSFALSKDAGASHAGSIGYGTVVGHPSLVVVSVSQECAKLKPRTSGLPVPDLPLGAVLEIIPNHSCLCFGVHQRVYTTTDFGPADKSSSLERIQGW